MSRRITTRQFIEKAVLKHGNKYDYSKTVYKDAYTEVLIICPKHGPFYQKACSHLFGKGCRKCGYDTVKIKNSITEEEFLKKAQEIHGDKYDYSEVHYISGRSKIKIFCKRCKTFFYQSAHNHISGQGCKKCVKELNGLKARKTTKGFIKDALKVHGDLYDYSKSIYTTNHTPVEIICKKHGSFWQLPVKHVCGRQGCPKCHLSVGESQIYVYLKNNNIKFVTQYKFKNCVDQLPLPFDFAVLNEDGSVKFLIEYQGIQHFEARSGFGGVEGFNVVKRHDNIKQTYCINNNIPLHYITYKETVEERLKEIFND